LPGAPPKSNAKLAETSEFFIIEPSRASPIWRLS